MAAADAAIAAANSAIADAADLPMAEKDARTGQVTALNNQLAAAKKSRTAAINARNAAAALAAQRVRNAASLQVAKAINAHGVGNMDKPPEEFVVDTTSPDLGMMITRGTGATKITPYQDSADEKNKPFTVGTAQNAGTGWAGMTFKRSGMSGKRSHTETAVVYTDKEAAGDILWISATFPGASAPTVNQTTGAVTIVGGTSIPGDRISVKTPIGTGKPGTFYGMRGTFTCSNCQVERGDNGMVTPSGDLTFTPGDSFDPDTDLARSIVDDLNYTHFGYWMKSTKQRDGTYVHDIETFSGGMTATADDLSTVVGSASYYGAAGGVYVKKTGTGDALVVTDGMFTADAMLTAKFGGSGIAVDDQFKISGTISDFMDGGSDLGFSDLMLNADFGGGPGAVHSSTTVTDTFMGSTQGGGKTGKWSGAFHGKESEDAADAFPTDVSGQFNGHFVNGHVAGAFGAEKD
ncbi:MAG: hypothetical protein OXI81_01370 [Paracoccaceae bacterium]|nr:hypothetical protein [Paracoccaceae bacterium]